MAASSAVFRSMTIHPAASTCAAKLADTKVEVSSSAIIAGPGAGLAPGDQLVAAVERHRRQRRRARPSKTSAALRDGGAAASVDRRGRCAADRAFGRDESPTSSAPRSPRPGSAARTARCSPCSKASRSAAASSAAQRPHRQRHGDLVPLPDIAHVGERRSPSFGAPRRRGATSAVASRAISAEQRVRAGRVEWSRRMWRLRTSS